MIVNQINKHKIVLAYPVIICEFYSGLVPGNEY